MDSPFSHLAWISTPRNKGGLGGLDYPLLADLTKSIAKDYEVLIEEGEGLGTQGRRGGGEVGGMVRWWVGGWVGGWAGCSNGWGTSSRAAPRTTRSCSRRVRRSCF